jgi:sugar lactone lactonase YvrE
MHIQLHDLKFLGENLHRPESVIATAKGELFVSDHECSVHQLGQPKKSVHGVPEGFLTNGIALTPQKEFLVANLGAICGGGLWKIDRQRQLSPVLMEVDGEPMSSTNFVSIDAKGRRWISISTRKIPRTLSFNAHVSDGFIALIDEHGARIVADGITFTNECRVDPTGRWLYVNETYGRRLSRYPIIEQAVCKLGPIEVIHTFSDGDFPDGLAFDCEGSVWVACVISNRVIRVDKNGQGHIVVEDPNPTIIANAEAKFAGEGLTFEDAYAGTVQTLGNVSSVAFGGPDLKTVYLGSLGAQRIATFRSAIAGAQPPHWFY